MTTNRPTLETEIRLSRSGYTASPRMVWNGGFWDGVWDGERGERRIENAGARPLPAWSPFYRAGYNAGVTAGSEPRHSTTGSTPWWDLFVETTSATQTRRMIEAEVAGRKAAKV